MKLLGFSLASVFTAACLTFVGSPKALAKPLEAHPDNPHYLVYRGKPTILIGSGEHYGAVLNLDFDYVRYLDELKAKGLNVTRTFTGAYVEPQGAFNIAKNTLAPSPHRFIAPWARSSEPGYAQGGNKFDLMKWDPAYFRRLKDFLTQAEKRGVIVEMNLFCPFYEEPQWNLSPQNATNNVNDLGQIPRNQVYTLDKHGGLLSVHEALVRKIVTELKGFDNLYYEICNEPYFGGVTMEWQHHIADVIVETEKKLKTRHLIAMNIANGSARIQNPHPAIAIFNFHYATPPTAVALNSNLNKVIGDNETGFRGTNDLPYRTEAWEFIIAGGGLFNHLDYSFTADEEDGTFVYPTTQPGGGNPRFRNQMKILKEFIHGFNFVAMRPDSSFIKRGVPVGATARALVDRGQAYAIYIGPTSTPKDQFSVRWTGRIEPKHSETYTFFLRSDDAARLWINSQAIATNWTSHAEQEESGSIALKAGLKYDLRLEYFQSGGNSSMKLLWSSPSQPQEIIPPSRLYTPDGRDHGLQGRYFTGRNFDLLKLSRNDANVDFDWTGNSPLGAAVKPASTNLTSDLTVDLPPGTYRAEWISPVTGLVQRDEKFSHTGGTRSLPSPAYNDDIALRIKKQ